MRTPLLLFIAAVSAALSSIACGGTTLASADAGTGPDAAPDSGDDSRGCHSTDDCTGQPGTTCEGPYGTGGCVCQTAPSCTEDSQCDAGTVCGHILEGVCQGYESLHCFAPCTSDSECTPTDACSSDGHCEPRTCANCPSYFTCSNDICLEPSCTTDSQCPGGFCVNGSCAVSLGMCTPECV